MSREVLLRGVEQTPPPVVVEHPHPVPIQPAYYGERTGFVLNPDQWLAFFDHVVVLRRLQTLVRRTLDPVMRRELDALEHRLDVEIGCVRLAFGENVRPCPTCGRPMSGSAAPWRCDHCGLTVGTKPTGTSPEWEGGGT